MKAPILKERDWQRLRELRASFLGAEELGAQPLANYWNDPELLTLYAATFGERIGWKWDAVLEELAQLGWRAPLGSWLDYGCGSGTGLLRMLAGTHSGQAQELLLVDRSAAARSFTRAAALELVPGLRVRESAEAGVEAPALLLVSHVLNELSSQAESQLLALAERAQSVLWVEPGSRVTSRRLSAVRERLLPTHRPLAPCPHEAPCAALALGHEQDWCHHWAQVPSSAFQSAHWRSFSRELSIDLRALSYCFLLLERRAAPCARSAAAPAPGPQERVRARVLGRPHAQKGRVLLDACQADGWRRLQLLQREAPALARNLERIEVPHHSLEWRIEGPNVREPRTPA